jgi:hypothetical protein
MVEHLIVQALFTFPNEYKMMLKVRCLPGAYATVCRQAALLLPLRPLKVADSMSRRSELAVCTDYQPSMSPAQPATCQW